MNNHDQTVNTLQSQVAALKVENEKLRAQVASSVQEVKTDPSLISAVKDREIQTILTVLREKAFSIIVLGASGDVRNARFGFKLLPIFRVFLSLPRKRPTQHFLRSTVKA